MRHEHRHRHVFEKFAADAAEQGFAQWRMMVSAADDHVGRQIGGAREQDVRYGEVAAQGFFGIGLDPVLVQVMDGSLECLRPVPRGDRRGPVPRAGRVEDRAQCPAAAARPWGSRRPASS